MSRSAAKLRKARGERVTLVNGHSVQIRLPEWGFDVEKIAENLLKFKDHCGDSVFDFSGYKPYVRQIAQCMGLKQEGLPCCYGPQMPQGISKSVKAS